MIPARIALSVFLRLLPIDSPGEKVIRPAGVNRQ